MVGDRRDERDHECAAEGEGDSGEDLAGRVRQEGSGVRRSCRFQPLARSAASRDPLALKAAAMAAQAHIDTMK